MVDTTLGRMWSTREVIVDKINDSLIVIQEQMINDVPISGLKLQFRKGRNCNILTIYGNFEYGNRDFYFDKKGKFDAAGIGVGQCQRDGS